MLWSARVAEHNLLGVDVQRVHYLFEASLLPFPTDLPSISLDSLFQAVSFDAQHLPSLSHSLPS